MESLKSSYCSYIEDISCLLWNQKINQYVQKTLPKDPVLSNISFALNIMCILMILHIKLHVHLKPMISMLFIYYIFFAWSAWNKHIQGWPHICFNSRTMNRLLRNLIWTLSHWRLSKNHIFNYLYKQYLHDGHTNSLCVSYTYFMVSKLW